MLDDLLSRYRNHDRLALARLLTLVARGEQLEAIRAAIEPHQAQERALVVSITGNTGVGKSTLVGRLAEYLRGQNQTVAVLACDPQSPLTGGALLGDRVRMPSRPDDAGLYIRSLAAAGGHQAVAEHVDLMLRVFGAVRLRRDPTRNGRRRPGRHGRARTRRCRRRSGSARVRGRIAMGKSRPAGSGRRRGGSQS